MFPKALNLLILGKLLLHRLLNSHSFVPDLSADDDPRYFPHFFAKQTLQVENAIYTGFIDTVHER